jgi:hypothetical protein
MSWSREEALADPAIFEPVKFLSEFRFSLRDIPVEITIRLYQPVHSGRIVIRRSHEVTVDGINPATAQSSDDDSVMVYNAARTKGLKPDRAWLKPNNVGF